MDVGSWLEAMVKRSLRTSTLSFQLMQMQVSLRLSKHELSCALEKEGFASFSHNSVPMDSTADIYGPSEGDYLWSPIRSLSWIL
jgi:hypothetical protein